MGDRRRQRRRRRHRRSSERRELTLPEEFLGVAWARRLRIGIPLSALLLFLGACAVFLNWSQTIGTLMMVPAVFVGLMWFCLRTSSDERDGLASLGRVRWPLLGLGITTGAGAWAVFLAASEIWGLLLALLGGLMIAIATLGGSHDTAGGPIDGPHYGDTGG